MSTEIARQLAEFTVRTKLEDVPKEVIEYTKALTLKTVAGTIAGSTFPASKKMAKYVRGRSQAREVGILGNGFKASLWEAVLAHTVFAHASELEDDRFLGGSSWDITVLPVTLGIAERNELSGKEFLEASIVGLEVHCRTCLFPADHLGLQIVPGAIGPAAAAAKALGLGIDETMSAMGLAMASGQLSFLNFGTDAHYTESGIQSWHGLLAAELAQAGMNSNPEIERYLAYLLGREKVRDPEIMTENLGEEWALQEIWVKKYPCCFGAHRQIDAVLELMREHDLSNEQIAELEVHVSRVDRVLNRPEPKTLGDLQFSFHHLLSAAMVDKDVNVGHINTERIDDPSFRETRAKVKVIVHHDWVPRTMESPALIALKLKDGRVLSRERKYPIGSREEPLTVEQLRGLYRKFTQGVLTEEQIQNTADQFLNLEKLDNIKVLMQLLNQRPS